MKRNLISMLGMSLLLLLGACSQETPVGGGKPIRGKGGLTIEVEGLVKSGAATRAPENAISVKGENTISNLYLLYFDPETGVYSGYHAVEGIPAAPDQAGDSNVPMNVDGIEYPGDRETAAWNILAIANIDEGYFVDGGIAAWMAQWEGKDEEFVTMNAVAGLPTAIASNRILMHGRIEKPENEDQLHLLLKRDAARLDVSNSVGADYDLISATVWNSFPTTSIWDQSGVDANAKRVERHQSVTVTRTGTATAPWPTTIQGGLYAFENRVAALTPATYNDRLTTCLIIGLRPAGSTSDSDIRYYRANIHNANGAQNLVRNHVYNLVITGVRPDSGKTTEQEAYLGSSNELTYFIGDWSEDLNGLVVSDEFSTLSIPTKMIALSSGKDLPAGEKVRAEFRIHTFSTLTNPAPLAIRSQTYTPAMTAADPTVPSITAHLDGNTLVVEAEKLDADNTPRNGVIVLSFAGLEIAMNVSQSGTNDYFLIVTEPDGGILPFAAYAGIPTGLISVQASGHWTAKLYMGGFSFDNQQETKLIWTNPADPDDEEYTFTDGRGYNTTMGLLTPDESDPTVDKFRVWTHSANMDTAPRQSFVVISLDGEDEDGNKLADTYSSIVMLTQTFVKALHYTPSHSPISDIEANKTNTGGVITFNGVANLATGVGYENNSDWFYVVPGSNTGSTINMWQAVLVPNGTTDDREFFEIVRDPDVDNHTQYSSNNPAGNKVMARAKGTNMSGREYRATLRVQTDPGTFADITLTQLPADWAVPVAPIVPAEGGEIELELDTYAGMNYTVEIAGVIGENHYAYLKDPDETGTIGLYSKLLPRNTPQKFIVGFPKMIYPNLNTPVAATVSITMAGQTKTFTVTQAAPTMHRIGIFNITGNESFHGSLTNSLTSSFGSAVWGGEFTTLHYKNQLGDVGVFGPGGTVKTAAPVRLVGNAAISNSTAANFTTLWNDVKESADVRYVHYSLFAISDTAFDATETAANQAVWDWAEDHEGVVVVNSNHYARGDAYTTQWQSSRLFGMLGFTGHSIDYLPTDGQIVSLPPTDNRVMDYLVGGDGPFGADNGTYPKWQTGYSNYIDASSIDEEGQYPILQNTSGVTGMIDARRRIVVSANAESVLGMIDARQQRVMNDNLRAWIVNCAQFGSHFSDYFWDSPRWKESYGTAAERVVPAPQE